jgi:hypothetical protein
MPPMAGEGGSARAWAPVCVTGMHRSGTSLLAGMVGDLGIDMGRPAEMITAEMFGLPADDQPGGYHENVRFLRIDDEVLARLGGDNYRVPELPAGWATGAPVAAERRRAKTLVEELQARAPWGFKDPRAMLVLELWLDVVANLHVVLCVRNPVEVARSVAARGHVGVDDALRWWLRCYEVCMPVLPPTTVVVAFDQVVGRPQRELRRIIDLLDHEVTADRLAVAASRVDHRLHRQRAPLDLDALPRGVRAMYEQLRERAVG